MPQAEFSVERFDREYPEQLPARLKWLEDHLRIGRDRMLRLMGLPRREAATARNRAWPKLVKDYELQAERLEQLLTHYLAYFDYDVEKAKAFARDFSQKVAAGTHRLSDSIPALASAKTPVDKEAALMEAARQEGSNLLPALARLLGSSSESDGENGTAARPRSPRGRRPQPS